MAKGKNIGCMTMAYPKPETVTLGGRSIMPIVQKLGLGIADLTKGVAKLSLSLSEKRDEVVVRTAESMQTKCVSTPLPNTPNFKSKKKTSKVALPDWLLNWQNDSKSTMPTRPNPPKRQNSNTKANPKTKMYKWT